MNDRDVPSRSAVLAAESEERPRSVMRCTLVLVALLVVARLVAGHILKNRDPEPPRQPLDVRIVKIVQPPPPRAGTTSDPVIAEVDDAKPAGKPMDMVVDSRASQVAPPTRLRLDAKPKTPPGVFNLPGAPAGGGAGWGWYASLVQEQISAALLANPRTRDAELQVRVQLWADATGHVRKVIMSSTGDPALDAVIRDNVLASLVLREPPPKGMPMPIIAHLDARRSG